MPNSRLVMVIDDEEDIVIILRHYLKKWNFETEGYTVPSEAMAAFQADPSKYDLVITDVKMPDINGVDLAAMMLKIKPDTRIVLSTAYDSFQGPISRVLAQLPNPPRVIQKPFNLAAICDSTKKHLQIQC